MVTLGIILFVLGLFFASSLLVMLGSILMIVGVVFLVRSFAEPTRRRYW